MSQQPLAGLGVRPILFSWRGLHVPSYPAMMYLGIVVGIVATNVAAKSIGLASARVYAATLLLIPVGLIGARLLFVAVHWDLFEGSWSRIWRRGDGGSAEFGGVLLVMAVSVPLLALLQIPFGAFWDVASFTFLIGAMFTRVGCLLNGCCAGRPTASRVGVYLPDDLGAWERRFPAQLLASAWAGVLLIPAVILLKSHTFSGGVFLFTLGAYSLGRVVLERVRLPDQSPNTKMQRLHSATHYVLALIPLSIFLTMWRG